MKDIDKFKKFRKLDYVSSIYINGNNVVVLVNRELEDYDEIFNYLLIKLKMPASTDIRICTETYLKLDVASLEDVRFTIEQGEKVYSIEGI